MSTPSLDPAIRQSLVSLATNAIDNGINYLFENEEDRANRFSFDINGIFIDVSKTHISDELLDNYLAIAEQASLTQKRHALFSGEAINVTENRSVLHPLLRDVNNQGIKTVSSIFLEQASDAKRQLLSKASQIETLLSKRSVKVTNIIHVGIGGSSLGTQLLFEAIAAQESNIKIHFVGNIDAHKLVKIFSDCDPKSTIVIGVSKTFTTAETLKNIRTISTWYKDHQVDDYWKNFYAVTANYQNALDFGIDENNIVTFPEWVGGRYSVWSSVSLSAVLVMGIDRFEEFISGASEIDQYFYQTDLTNNVCFITAMLDHFYANFMGAGSRAVFPYDARLESLVSYLQQLETESNGKDRQIDGKPVDQNTSTVVWGGVGTDVQHSVFQMLHQGTSLIPSEFLIVKKPDHQFVSHHTELLANAIAQPAALLAGQSLNETKDIYASVEVSDVTLKSKIFSGEKPSSTLIMERLSPRVLGMLLAFYEHRVFCAGVLNNINSYDQMGVELGKRLATEVKPLIAEATSKEAYKDISFDASTKQLINLLIK